MTSLIDITMTATLRPAIFSVTLESIKKCVIGTKDINNFTLILNIDSIGENVKPKEMIKIANKYFTNVKYNISENPSFPKAVKWVWSQATADYIFHIEDDWKFLKKIDVMDMIRILNKNEKLSSLRLYKYNTPGTKTFKTFMCKWVYQEDGYYLATDWKKQFGLNPILIKKKFIDESLPNMVDNVNPEKQFRSSQPYMEQIIKKWQYGLYTVPGQHKLVEDIGRSWIRRQKYTKPKKGSFVAWEHK